MRSRAGRGVRDPNQKIAGDVPPTQIERGSRCFHRPQHCASLLGECQHALVAGTRQRMPRRFVTLVGRTDEIEDHETVAETIQQLRTPQVKLKVIANAAQDDLFHHWVGVVFPGDHLSFQIGFTCQRQDAQIAGENHYAFRKVSRLSTTVSQSAIVEDL
jgi:hypothetical protein